MADFSEILSITKSTATAFDEFKRVNDERQAALLDRIEALEAARSAGGKATSAATPPKPDNGVRWLETKTGDRVPQVSSKAKLADAVATDARAVEESKGFSIGDFVRDAMLGTKAASSTATVPTLVGSQVIDRVRALTVLVRAGASTINIAGPTVLAKVTSDATVVAHTEAANDITESDVTLAGVTLNPQLLAALVPLSVELVADSPNVDEILQTSLAAAFASKVDTLGIAAILAASGLPVSASAHDPATWTGTNAAIAAALAANQDLPRAHISTPSNYAARSVILASTAGSWLGKPPYLEGMVELFTSSMTTDQAVFGDFEAGCALVTRSDLRLEIVRHGKPGHGSHLLVAHARMGIVPLQVGKLYWQKKTP